MIQLTSETQIRLAVKPVDFRRGIDSLSALCRLELEQDPRSGILFVFINRSRTMIRILNYDGSGYWLMTKRLSKGKFVGWPHSHKPLNSVQAKQLKLLLWGKAPGSSA